MRGSIGLTLAALGAILAFAVHLHLPYINPNAVGWVLMLVGIGGLFAPRGTRRWMRQRLIMRDGRYGPVVEASDTRYSRHLMPGGLLVSGVEDEDIGGSAIEEHVVEE
jgi:uncharacterized membrane protein YidH (DUF202 family)